MAEAEQRLPSDRFILGIGTTPEENLGHLRDRGNPIDCLVIEATLLGEWLPCLAEAGILLPVVVVTSGEGDLHPWDDLYHGGMVTLRRDDLDQLEAAIHQAIQQFLDLPAGSCALPTLPPDEAAVPQPELLSAQQDRLTDKLKARLGYLGVYYKRNPEYFLRNMSQVDRDTLLNQLRGDYRKIVLGYFSGDAKLNQNIDTFVNQAFMADIAVSLIVEIHMDLMDEFSKQLKLEGRSEEILLDYRLTLIDVIAHLCEMYRRSIPREP